MEFRFPLDGVCGCYVDSWVTIIRTRMEKSDLADFNSVLVFPSLKWCEAEHLKYNLGARSNAACVK